MANPFAHHEDRAAHVKSIGVVFEGRAVSLAHQKADQAVIALVHRLLAGAERDASGIDDREIVGHRRVESDEAIGKDVNLIHAWNLVGGADWTTDVTKGSDPYVT